MQRLNVVELNIAFNIFRYYYVPNAEIPSNRLSPALSDQV